MPTGEFCGHAVASEINMRCMSRHCGSNNNDERFISDISKYHDTFEGLFFTSAINGVIIFQLQFPNGKSSEVGYRASRVEEDHVQRLKIT